MDGHGASRRANADDRLDLFLAHVFVDQEVAGLDELGRCEAPLVAAADHERVFGRCLQAAVDDHEAVVLAEADDAPELMPLLPPEEAPLDMALLPDPDDPEPLDDTNHS